MKSVLYGIIISIHAPREGGDPLSSHSRCNAREFQSTPPARGATHYLIANIFRFLFQSTPPARGATFYMAALLTSLGISIHAPREGGDFLSRS